MTPLSRPEREMLLKLNSDASKEENIKSDFFNGLPISVLIAHCIECTSHEDVEFILNYKADKS